MKRLWKLLTSLLLLPIFPVLAIPDGGGDPPTGTATADPPDGTRTLEQMAVTVKALADSVEGYEERMKEQYGKDLKAIQDEADKKRADFEKKMTEEIRKAAQPHGEQTRTEPADPTFGFGEGVAGFGEFVRAAYMARQEPHAIDKRLVEMHAHYTRELTLGTGTEGGFLVGPQQWTGEILKMEYPQMFLQSRCRRLPAGASPDAELPIPALDQSGSKGMYSGVTVYPLSEGATMTENAGPTLKQVLLKPNEQGAYINVTEKLLRNSAALGAFVISLLRAAIQGYTEAQIATGDGVGNPLGFIGCDAQYAVDRDTASEINYIDTVNMLTRVLPGGNYVWVGHVLTKPQLMTMTDGTGRILWQPNVTAGVPPTLHGLPVLFSEYLPTLGTEGDFVLVDMSYYLLRDGAPIRISDDQGLSGTNFRSNRRDIKGIFSVDGQVWPTGTMMLQDGTTEVSPFVVLAA